MSNEKRDQQQPQNPASRQAPVPRGEFAKKGVLAAIGGAFSGTVRALWAHVFGDSA